MFYRNTRINLPQLDVKVKKDVLDESIENCDKQARQRMKSYADQRRRAINTRRKATSLQLTLIPDH